MTMERVGAIIPRRGMSPIRVVKYDGFTPSAGRVKQPVALLYQLSIATPPTFLAEDDRVMTTQTEQIRERLRPRIVETAETGRLDLGLPAVPEPALAPPQRQSLPSPFAVAVTGLGILVVGVVGIDLAQFVDGAFAHGTAVGVLAAMAVAAGAGGCVYWLMTELRGLWRLRSAERLRRLIPSALAAQLKQEIDAAAAILARDPLLGGAVTGYRAALQPHHSGRDALELFSRLVLAPADRLAQAAIRRAAAQAFAINAISPTVLLDTLFFAARAMRLIREIAEVYGQRPGLAGTVHLLRRLAAGAGLVGAVDVVGGVIAQQLGGAVLERLSASAAESAYAAQKMARLGLVATALCRPIEFRPGEAPSLRGLVSGLLKGSGAGTGGAADC
jgi:putative membrane protein